MASKLPLFLLARKIERNPINHRLGHISNPLCFRNRFFEQPRRRACAVAEPASQLSLIVSHAKSLFPVQSQVHFVKVPLILERFYFGDFNKLG